MSDCLRELILQSVEHFRSRLDLTGVDRCVSDLHLLVDQSYQLDYHILLFYKLFAVDHCYCLK